MRITDKLLDVLGFSEYWDNHGTSGCRTLTICKDKYLRIVEVDETEDQNEGYGAMYGHD